MLCPGDRLDFVPASLPLPESPVRPIATGTGGKPSGSPRIELVLFTLYVKRKGCHSSPMIRSFRCKRTEALYEGKACYKDWRNFRKVAERKLQQLDAARRLADLKAPPSNSLEALKRERKGQHAIRINDVYRLCFIWTDEGPEQVEIVDYH